MRIRYAIGASMLAWGLVACGNGASTGPAAQAAATPEPAARLERFATANPDFPFSKAVRVGDVVFVSGQIGLDGERRLAEDFQVQSRQTMDNLKADVESIGLSMDDLVKCTLMLADMSRWAEFNEIYRTYFSPDQLPARSAFGANGLALGAQVEIECIAAARHG